MLVGDSHGPEPSVWSMRPPRRPKAAYSEIGDKARHNVRYGGPNRKCLRRRACPSTPDSRHRYADRSGPCRAMSRHFGGLLNVRCRQQRTLSKRIHYPRHGRMLSVLHLHPELRPSGLIGERGRGASTLTSQGRNLHALQDASGRMGVVKL